MYSSPLPLKDQLSISIATKNRPDDLQLTLEKILDFGLGECPLVIYDDGSTPALAPAALAGFAHYDIIRSELSHGQAHGRNCIAQSCTTPYILQLDDDSHPAPGSIAKLVEFMESSEGLLGIAIPFEEPSRKRTFPRGIPKDELIQISVFVGCSVLLRREAFLALGGYRTWIGGWGEEDELALRALDNDLRVVTVDTLRITHRVTDVGRNPGRIAQLTFRNRLLINYSLAPRPARYLGFVRLTAGALLNSLKTRSLAPLRGLMQGAVLMGAKSIPRDTVSVDVFSAFGELPHALDFFESSAERQPG